MAASGGYWLACAADEIYADESSIVGSIGVVSAGFGFNDLIDRHGIERRVHTAGKRKMILDPFKPEDEEDIAALKDIQRDIHGAFKALVRKRRAGKLKGTEEELFEGAFWTGAKGVGVKALDTLQPQQRAAVHVPPREVAGRRKTVGVIGHVSCADRCVLPRVP